MSTCKFCSREATEANGMCFDDAEEMAVLVHDATLEFGGTPEQAARNAQAAWS
jgi:hypothetical protein